MRTYIASVALSVAVFILGPEADAQSCTSPGPDIIIGNLNSIANYSAVGDEEIFSFGHEICNIGDAPVGFVFGTPDHPVFGKNLFRVTLQNPDGSTRIEQLGYSWLLHGFFALSQQLCCTDCQPGNGTVLGVRCSDSNTASRSGSQTGLGPKWQINPHTGEFPFPAANPPVENAASRRLRVPISALTPSSSTSLYFVEGVVVSADDAAAGNQNNNASYRPVIITGSGNNWNGAMSGTTLRGVAAIEAWRAADPAVKISVVDVPSDGRILVAGRANAIPNQPGYWHYEYAIYNLNSQRSLRSFTVYGGPENDRSNIGFHDIAYHSGDGIGSIDFDGTDWSVTGNVTWSTQTFSQNPSANALRWGTLYNFRFDVPAPPETASASLELFEPGTPDSVSADSLPVPGFRTGDTNGDQIADLNDLAAVLSAFGACAGEPAYVLVADFDRSGCVDIADLAIELSWFGR